MDSRTSVHVIKTACRVLVAVFVHPAALFGSVLSLSNPAKVCQTSEPREQGRVRSVHRAKARVLANVHTVHIHIPNHLSMMWPGLKLVFGTWGIQWTHSTASRVIEFPEVVRLLWVAHGRHPDSLFREVITFTSFPLKQACVPTRVTPRDGRVHNLFTVDKVGGLGGVFVRLAPVRHHRLMSSAKWRLIVRHRVEFRCVAYSLLRALYLLVHIALVIPLVVLTLYLRVSFELFLKCCCSFAHASASWCDLFLHRNNILSSFMASAPPAVSNSASLTL
ncbi:hypothetical protein Pelo_17906 [Pelomyxa schiedti]|nr:hypothetical protein Pelo_17906 [Pelomyxa schiedti]